MSDTLIEIYTKHDCHLCESAKDVLNRVTKDYPLKITEIDITGDENKYHEFKDSIPVVFINKKREFIYKVNEITLRKKLNKLLNNKSFVPLPENIEEKSVVKNAIIILLCFLLLNSCHRFMGEFKPYSGVVILHSARPDTISVSKIAILPFKAGSFNQAENGTVICHLTGQSFKSGKVEPDSGRNVASLFYQRLSANKSIKLIPENDVNLVYESIDAVLIDKYDFSLGKMVGENLNADAVLIGVVLRYAEREGTSWAINKPASAAFTAVLIDVRTGEILWKVRFDKTQQALFENLLDMKIFFKGRGMWQTVDQLLSIGIEGAIKNFPVH